MVRRLLSVVIIIAALAEAQQPVRKVTENGPVDRISEQQLYDYLSFIAADELEGRDTPSRGLDITARFLSTHLSRWGFRPAGDSGSFFQRIMLHKTRVVPAATSMTLNGVQYYFGSDFISASTAGTVTAPMVFVKNGYIIRSKGIDPYAGLDVKGKIMLVLDGYPKGVTRGDFGLKLGEDYDTPSNYAKMNGAAAIVVIPSAKALAQWEKDRTNAVTKGSLSVPGLRNPEEKTAVPTVTASLKLVEAIFSGERTGVQTMSVRAHADSAAPFALTPSRTLSVSVGTRIDTLWTQNVVAVWEGSDKKLKNEYVAFGAHYDHVGLRPEPLNGDSIYNGADDDGSGTAGLLAMAEALTSAPRPKRSVLFVWHTGEEKGLWGSKYFVRYPTVPLKDIVVQLNIDMIGRSKPDTGADSRNEEFVKRGEIFSIGSKMMSTELGDLNEKVNSSLHKLSLNYRFDDPKDPNRLFYRSDHYNYAKNGIPVVFYFDGLHEDYHRVSDEVDKIDFPQYTKVTQTIFALGWRIANLSQRIVVDKEFSADTEE